MKQYLKQKLKNNKNIYKVASLLRLILSSSFFKVDGHRKKYPKVIQLPITYNCNSKCVMCNIWKMKKGNEAKVDEFERFMSDRIFKNVESVGVNGGEPSLVKNLPEYISKILNLPKIKNVNIISNGFVAEHFFTSLKTIYSMCKQADVNFHLSFSLDGKGSVHDLVRGVPRAFTRATETIDRILADQSKYCDSLDVGCTVTKQNIDNLVELDTYAVSKGYNMKYRLGIENKRIESHLIKDSFSVLEGEWRKKAQEFFHWKLCKAEAIHEKFKYFAIYMHLVGKAKKRLLGCMWKENGITLDARGNLYYCAVASDCIGSLREGSGEKIFFNTKNIEYRKKILANNCDNCIHDYTGRPSLKNVALFCKWLLVNRYTTMKFKFMLGLMK